MPVPEILDRSARSAQAEQAWARLATGGSQAARLRVMCSASHHLATVYDTDAGLVYASTIRAHSHGDRDLPDTPHHGHQPRRWFDLLQAPGTEADDLLPAWCDCGQRSLSRRALQEWCAQGEHRVIVD